MNSKKDKNLVKNIVIRVEPELHTQIKIKAAINNTSIQDYATNLFIKDLNSEDDDVTKKVIKG